MRIKNKDYTAFSVKKNDLDKLKINRASYEAKHGKHFSSMANYLLEISEYLK